MKKLYLSTEGFPYGTTEKSFILPELEELCKFFEVVIISHAKDMVYREKKNETLLSRTVKVYNIDVKLQWYKRIFYGFRFFFDRDGWHEIEDIMRSKEKIFYRLYQSIGFYALALENYRMMREIGLLQEDENAVYYSYWYFYYTYSLTRHTAEYPNVKLVTRTHGFDLYEERYNGGRQPFKKIMDVALDKIVFISEHGKKYYLKRWGGNEKKKYTLSYLGSKRETLVPLRQDMLSSEKQFCLVSCSALIPLKRVELIVRALSLLEEEIEWIHFGDGPDKKKLLIMANRLLGAKRNISWQIKGFIPNEDIQNFYAIKYVHCFITTSETEGLPVSIQEAISFGIPFIATNVGGIPELFNDNGILLNKNPSVEEVAEAIRKIIHMEKKEYEICRKNSFEIWERKYDAKKNSKAFVETLMNL